MKGLWTHAVSEVITLIFSLLCRQPVWIIHLDNLHVVSTFDHRAHNYLGMPTNISEHNITIFYW